MSATLTWSEYHGESNLQSTFAATNQGAMQLLNQYFTTLAGFADFPWQICSTELTTSPLYVTLKRKSGAAGRIIFMGISASVGTTMNPQLTAGVAWTTVGVRVAWFPSATSDTPANIISASGDVFSTPAGYTSLSPVYAYTSSANTFTCWACEDGLFLRYGTAGAATTTILIVGSMIENSSGVESGVAYISGSSMETTSPQLLIAHTSLGGFGFVSGVHCHFGAGWTPSVVGIYTGMRDNGTKKLWTLPKSLFSFQLPTGDGLKYKFRQITIGPTPLAGYERIAVDGDLTMAMSTHAASTAGYPWLTNYQV